MQFASFRRWLEKSSSTDPIEATRVHVQEALLHEPVPPEEAIDNGYSQLVAELADEIIESLLAVSWLRFEEIVDVLQALGYGGNRAGAGRAFKTTSDEGVDGVIDEDPLGLPKVFVQAEK